MRILHVIASTDSRGGGPRAAIASMIGPLRDLGFESEVASCDAPDCADVAGIDAPVHALGPGGGGYRYSPALRAWLQKNISSYDLAIVHGLWTSHGAAVRAAALGRVPYFVFPHGMLDPWFKRFRLKHLKKLIYWMAMERRVIADSRAVLFTCEQERLLAPQTFPLYRCLERVVSFGCAGLTGHEESQIETFLAAYPHLRGRRFHLFLGRLHPKKGPDLLLRAYARACEGKKAYPDLVIAGPPVTTAYRQELARICSEENLRMHGSPENPAGFGEVTFCPMLEGDLKVGAFRCSETFILPSHQENFGIAVAEAMSVGKPVLISDQVNIWREILDAGAGLVAPDNVSGTLSLFERWDQLPAESRFAFGEAAKKCFHERFSAKQAAVSLAGVLTESRVSARSENGLRRRENGVL